MGRTRDGDSPRKDNTAQLAAPPSSMKVASFPSPSPSSSSSSSDFEFNVALSPSSKRPCSHLCPADELFYKGQLLPLHLPPRISMVRALLLASSSTSSSSDTTTTASRDSNGSSSSSFSADLQDCDSSRPSSVNEEEARRVGAPAGSKRGGSSKLSFFATRFSSVFLHRGSKKDQNNVNLNMNTPILTSKKANVSSISSSSSSSFSSSSSSAAKGVIKKCVKKVKPLYDKLSSLQQKPNPLQQPQQKKTFSFSIKREKFTAGSFSGKKLQGADRNCTDSIPLTGKYSHPKSFSGNLGEPRRKDQWATSCPSSIRSSPSHSGLLCLGGSGAGEPQFLLTSSSTSSIDELQNAIQGAIAHCKSTMTQSMNQKKASGQAISNKEIDRS